MRRSKARQPAHAFLFACARQQRAFVRGYLATREMPHEYTWHLQL
jgi:hypothetical protein